MTVDTTTTDPDAVLANCLAPGGDSALHRAVRALLEPDASLDAVIYLLRLMGTTPAEQIDPSPYRAQARLQTLSWFIARKMSEQWSDTIRCAPPAAIAEVVRDAVTTCKGPRCETDVAPWEDEGPDFCSAACRVEDSVAHGDDEPFDMSGATPGVER